MKTKLLWSAGLRRHRGSILGIFVLVFLISLSLAAVLTLWENSGRYVRGELERLGYGRITAWVSGIPDAAPLAEEIASVEGVEAVGLQQILYAEYETGGQESDSEGQLITYDPERYPYKIFTQDLSGYQEGDASIGPGEIYVSPSLCSIFGVKAGDTITFPIARSGVEKAFTVKGFFEDPFMGSSMIGMKSFLISPGDHDEIAGLLAQAGIDGLARDGWMLHIHSRSGSAAELGTRIHEETSLQSYLEFSHSDSTISGFMLTLQNVFTGLLLAFVLVLLLVSLVVISHSISGTIEQDTADLSALKTMGITSGGLRWVQLLQFLTGILPGIVLGLLAAMEVSVQIRSMTVTSTGILIPAGLPAGLCLAALSLLLALLMGFVWKKTGPIGRVSPMETLRKAAPTGGKVSHTPIHQAGLGFWLAVRQLSGGKRRYLSTCLTALLLVFFASLAGRVNAWLGSNGEGLMDAFNPADLQIAAQPMGETTIEEVERTISAYTAITGRYLLGMPTVSVNGLDLTANVITQPERFHLLEGRTCQGPDEVVLTEFVAADLGVTVGDRVTIAAARGRADYLVCGIYQCANDMGANIGMNREGYALIGEESPTMWCYHYFLEDASFQPQVMRALEETYGGDVYLHENTWPGLAGILSAMKLLLVFLYGVTAVFIAVVTALAGARLLSMERKDLGIYKALGFPSGRLRRSFALRFGAAALAGGAMGTVCGVLLADPLVAALLRSQGISNFSAHPGIGAVLLPGLAVMLAFVAFAYWMSGAIKKVPLSVLTEESF